MRSVAHPWAARAALGRGAYRCGTAESPNRRHACGLAKRARPERCGHNRGTGASASRSDRDRAMALSAACFPMQRAPPSLLAGALPHRHGAAPARCTRRSGQGLRAVGAALPPCGNSRNKARGGRAPPPSCRPVDQVYYFTAGLVVLSDRERGVVDCLWGLMMCGERRCDSSFPPSPLRSALHSQTRPTRHTHPVIRRTEAPQSLKLGAWRVKFHVASTSARGRKASYGSALRCSRR